MKAILRKQVSLRLTVLLLLVTAIVVQHSVQAESESPFYQTQNGGFYHYVRESGTQFSDIEDAILNGYYADRGVKHLMVYCPYEASGDWRGVPPIDYFSVNSNTGTVQDFEDMVSAAHNEGMTVGMYIGTLFVHTDNDLWVQAQLDKANNINSDEAQMFRWSTTGSGSTPDFGGWSWSSVAQSYYATSWGYPALDYANQVTVDYMESVLQFWIDLGVDGFEFDAPTGHWGMSDQEMSDLLVTMPQTYKGAPMLIMAEGHIAEYGYSDWNDSIGFTHVLINGDDDSNSMATRVMDGYMTADQLESHFQMHLDPRRANGVGVKAVSNYSSLSGEQRALEAAVMAGVGSWYEIDYEEVYSLLSNADQQKYDEVFLAINSTDALAPGASRTRLSTGSDPQYYAVVRTSEDGESHALNIYNFKDESANITVDLSGSGIIHPQTPTNLVTLSSGTQITSDQYTVTLPAFGYVFLDIDRDLESAELWTVFDDSDNGWTYGNGWYAYNDPYAYQGTAHGGSTVTNAYGEFTFHGTAAELYTWKGPDGGTIEVFIDEVSQGTFSLYNSAHVWNQLIFSIDELEEEDHTIRVEAVDYDWTMIDYIRVLGEAGSGNDDDDDDDDGDGDWTTVDDDASGWTYGTGWFNYNDPYAYEGTAHGGNTAIDAYGEYTFYGTEVELYTWKGPDGGMIEVFIDSVSEGTFSLYHSSDVYDQLITSVSELTEGNHTIRIEALDYDWTMVDYLKFK